MRRPSSHLLPLLFLLVLSLGTGLAYGSEAVGCDTIPTPPLQQDTTILTPAKADALAVQQDSARLIPTEVPTKPEAQKTFSPSPRAAVLWAIIPGGGQVYNRKYWKVPIIIGGMTALYYAISWNNNNLIEYAKAYSDISIWVWLWLWVVRSNWTFGKLRVFQASSWSIDFILAISH